MEIIDKNLLKILVCPNCRSRILFRDKIFICSNCKEKFSSQNDIFSFLPKNFRTEKDFKHKEEQLKFFEEWSDRKRTNGKFEKNSFDGFFVSEGPNAKINYSETEIKRVINKLPPNSIVVELGCGAGEHTAFIASLRKDIYLTAIDISPKSVLETRERIKADKKTKCKVICMVADAEALPFKEKSIDSVVAVMFFHHVFSPDKSIKEINRVLSPQGLSLIVDIVSNNPINTFSRKIFPYMPIFLKKRFDNDYILDSGEIPLISLHSIEKLKIIARETKMRIVSEKRYDLFVFFIYNLATVFPIIKKVFPRSFLEKIYFFENNILKKNAFNNFAAVISLCISRQ